MTPSWRRRISQTKTAIDVAKDDQGVDTNRISTEFTVSGRDPETGRFAAGNPGKALDQEPTVAAGVLIDRGGFGVRIIFDKERPVLRGNNNTVMIRLADKTVAAKDVSVTYRLIPFGN